MTPSPRRTRTSTGPLAVRKPGGAWEARRAAEEPENAGIVRKLYECFNTRNERGVLALHSPRAELHSFLGTVEGHKFVGCSGVREWYGDVVGSLEMQIEPGEIMAYRNYVLSIPTVHISGGGRRQSFDVGIVYELADGRIERFFGYGRVGAAVKKLGSLLHGERELAI